MDHLTKCRATSTISGTVIKLEADTAPLVDFLAAEESAIGAPTLLETRLWCATNLAARSSRWLEEFINGQGTSVVPFSRDMADVASHAFVTFGRATRHPAKLNFGDCMAYAVAAVMRAPLLFKGRDFALTDILVHPASIRT